MWSTGQRKSWDLFSGLVTSYDWCFSIMLLFFSIQPEYGSLMAVWHSARCSPADLLPSGTRHHFCFVFFSTWRKMCLFSQAGPVGCSADLHHTEHLLTQTTSSWGRRAWRQHQTVHIWHLNGQTVSEPAEPLSTVIHPVNTPARSSHHLHIMHL